MSVQKWRQVADEKAVVDSEKQEIRQKIKMNKLRKEFGQLSGEELFKPITRRLDRIPEGQEASAAELEAAPDYDMDEFDRTNPFDEGFRPDEATPPPSPPSSPSPPPIADDDFPPPPPPITDEGARKTWGEPATPEFIKTTHESMDLQIVNQLITKFRNDPNYRVKSPKSKFHGYSVEDLKKIRDGIYARRQGARPLAERLQERKQKLAPTPPKTKTPSQLTPLERAVLDRRPSMASMESLDDDDEDDEWGVEGSGLVETTAEKLINQLYVSIGSIKSGNTSLKLKQQVASLLELLRKHDIITEYQKQKILRDYIQ